MTRDTERERAEQLQLAAERRRPGRRDAHPALLPMLRGEAVAGLPEGELRDRLDWEILGGAVLAAGLMVLGVMLRFVA